ncbi:hypothetical protein AX16_002634 [Volvariella volvacea WC 439]|nr:hypothetical protein AX16_002634 [Volvariella volvacea WC 439]
MNSLFARLVTVAILAVGVIAQSFTINTPTNVVVCQPVRITWSGGEGACLSARHPTSCVHDGNSPNGPAIRDLGSQDGTSFTWIVDFEPGTNLGLALRDNTGELAQTASFVVNSGPNRDCIGGGGGDSSSGGSEPTSSDSSTGAPTPNPPAPSPSSPGTGTGTGTGTSGTPTSSRTNTGTATGTSNPQETEGSDNGASTKAISLGTAGLVGAAVLALLA